MKFGSRVNSFLLNSYESVDVAIKRMASVEGLSHVDLNYPEHFNGKTVSDVSKLLKDSGLKLNGIALRFRNEFENGELGNTNPVLAEKALELCKEAVDTCRSMGGEVVTIWLGYDGFDYSFQVDYAKLWSDISKSFQEICEYGSDLRISIEYKPFQPRAYSIISSLGTTLTMINDVGADNLGGTLDFCHMLMKGENPAVGVCLLAERDRLYGVHLNDGNKLNDDGLMVGMVNFIQTLEFIYYLKKYKYEGVIYFDTFPIRENAVKECAANIRMVTRLEKLIDEKGIEAISKVVGLNDAVAVQEMFMDFVAH